MASFFLYTIHPVKLNSNFWSLAVSYFDLYTLPSKLLFKIINFYIFSKELVICVYCRALLELLMVPWLYTIEKNERICPFWGRFLIDSKYLYKEKEICFGIIGQLGSRICMTIPTIIWHIISYSVLKMCAF